MAVHQDCWSNTGKTKDGDLSAREWLSKLEIGDKLLHPPPQLDYNVTSPRGDQFETVFVKEKHDNHIIISYPNRGSMWDKKLPLKYAFTVRPINSIKSIHNNSNNSYSMTFKKSNQKLNKRRLNTFRNNHIIPKSPELTPEAANNTLFNKLHNVRQLTTTNTKLKYLYASSESKNVRNRQLLHNSCKKKGHVLLQQQCNEYNNHKKRALEQTNMNGHPCKKQKLLSNKNSINVYKQKSAVLEQTNQLLETRMNVMQQKLLNNKNSINVYKQKNAELKQQHGNVIIKNKQLETRINIMEKRLNLLECKSETLNVMNFDKLNELKQIMQKKMKLIEETERELIQNAFKCLACKDNIKNISLDGCSHLSLCDKCESQLLNKMCPICQAPYKNVKKVNF